MASADLHKLSIAQAGQEIKNRRLSPVELTQAYLDRIDRLNGDLGAYITVTAEQALASARMAESEIQAGRYAGPLHGVPIAVKDIISTQGVLTSAGSRVLSDNIPDHDSTIIERLNAAGAPLLGKLNLSEFAIGGTIDHPYGTPRNPWNTLHSAGGSSSGSAIATSGGLAAGTLGSDTGGSVRGPSAFCGIVGLRPTYGRVTRHAVVPMCWSMDTIGPMTRTVEDCALMLRVIAGYDPRDPSTSADPVPDYTAKLEDTLRGMRVGLPDEMFDFDGVDPQVKAGVEKAVTLLEELGVEAERVSLPTSAQSGAVFLAIADVDSAAFHSDWLRTRGDDYDWSTRTRLESASLAPATAYLRAQRARELIRREMLDTLDRCDVIIMPSSPTISPTIESATGSPGGYYQGRLDLSRRRYTSPAALAGLPSLSVPCGFSDTGLPMGMQITGKPFAEETLFQVGHAYEQATDWHTRKPNV
ncbi:MAG: aspartyl/glutamyl-tRNA amidotransferase subunit A [Chloroflexi bacterium]|nr:aspartyl/glutamyl-tRNA amidotransferase subunit A [Chloroflexota bacterium]MCH8310596.1 aspartyl/glutamyl-tRNA amidotransferase subunit A [Chloroflexota bacterium]